MMMNDLSNDASRCLPSDALPVADDAFMPSLLARRLAPYRFRRAYGLG